MIKKKWFLEKKKGNLLYPVVIFIVLNLIFISILLLFVYRASTGALIYEELYAKQISLLIDASKSDAKITIDFKKGLEIVEKNNPEKENLVSFENNKVVVRLAGEVGYSSKYFSDYQISSEFEENNLILTIKDKKDDK